MNTLGIDPGLKGALAILSPEEKLLAVTDMPTLYVTKTKKAIDSSEFIDILRNWQMEFGEFRVIAERVSVRGGQKGVIETCRNGFLLEGICFARMDRYEDVSPQRWQRSVFGADYTRRGKGSSRLMAQRLWPDADLGQRKSEDRSEAALIALYGSRLWAR